MTMKKALSHIMAATLVLGLFGMPISIVTAQAQNAQTETKPKRPRSAAQLRNDQLLRDCGAEWKANKAAGKTGNQKWIGFLAECRKRKSA